MGIGRRIEMETGVPFAGDLAQCFEPDLDLPILSLTQDPGIQVSDRVVDRLYPFLVAIRFLIKVVIDPGL